MLRDTAYTAVVPNTGECHHDHIAPRGNDCSNGLEAVIGAQSGVGHHHVAWTFREMPEQVGSRRGPDDHREAGLTPQVVGETVDEDWVFVREGDAREGGRPVGPALLCLTEDPGHDGHAIPDCWSGPPARIRHREGEDAEATGNPLPDRTGSIRPRRLASPNEVYSSRMGWNWQPVRRSLHGARGWEPVLGTGPLARTGLRQRVVPFGLVYVVAMSVAILATPSVPSWAALGAMLAWAAAAAAAAFLMPWYRWPPRMQVMLPVLMVASIGAFILVDAATTGIALVMLLPVAWVGLYGSRADVVVVLLACTTALLLPAWLALGGAADGPGDDIRRTILFLLIAGGLSWILQTARANTFVDPLTGIFNRRAWDIALAREMERSRRNSEPLCIAELDLDHFKALNDRHGHAAGDAHLQASAMEWARELRAYDTLARLGGEEFGVILPRTYLGDARSIVERIGARTPGGETVSAGLVMWNGRESADRLLSRADDALYAAKRDGRNRLVVN